MNFDLVVVGGGHAGVEAAWIAQQFELRVAIFTMPDVPIASTPCNPAVGGVGKGQVVRELDALGGLMGKIADRAGIQYRTLNESKGYAVRSTRIQVDKEKYAEIAEEILEKSPVKIVRKAVRRMRQTESGDFIITTNDGEEAVTQKLVVTTGTFLNGKLHSGDQQRIGGRHNCEASAGLTDLMEKVQTLGKRFKTGTPPRLSKKTIDFSKMSPQSSDARALNFHWEHDPFNRVQPQVSCYITHTNSQTLGLIRENKERSPMYNGQISAVGPRYCPSIEDKAFRYPDRDNHHVFVEPEGLDTDSVYPNGISTSLPADIQKQFIQTIEGLEDAEILVNGYAVEYDVVDTARLTRTLEYKEIPGLYFAGQVNGTSGYEEAAGQGHIAGVNAALAIKEKESLILDRYESYIGVMVDDLVSSQRDEPYRLFTARSENRLYLREDNSFLRMHGYRKKMGLSLPLDDHLTNLKRQYELLSGLLNKARYRDNEANRARFQKYAYGPLQDNMTLAELIKRSQLDPLDSLQKELEHMGVIFHPAVIRTVAIGEKYRGYINRFHEENRKLQKIEAKGIDWQKLVEDPHISNECRQRIESIRPETFGQLKKVDGIRTSTVAYVAGNFLR